MLAGSSRVIVLMLGGCGRLDFEPMPTTGDAMSIDARADTNLATCPASAVLCDDFEAGDLARWDSPVLASGSTVAVDTVHAHASTFALDAIVPMMGGNGATGAACKQVPLQSSGVLAMRAWVFTPTQLNSFQGVIELVNLGGCGLGNPMQYALVGCNNNNAWTVTENSTTGGLIDHPGGTCLAPATWTCVELDYNLDAPRRMQLYVNDALVVDTAPADQAPAFAELWLGVARATSPGYRAFADDAVIAHQHIGCL